MRKRFCKTLVTLILSCSLISMSTACNHSNSNEGGMNPDPSEEKVERFKDTTTVFVENKNSDYVIVIPENATPTDEYAANELNKYLKQATDVELTVESDAGKSFDRTQKYISIGDTQIYDDCGMTLEYTELNRDGYKIKTYGNTVVINALYDVGVLYGVYGFLEGQFNWEAYAGDEIYIEKTDKSYIKDFDWVNAPDFEGRETDGRLASDPYTASVLKLRNGAMSAQYFGAEKEFVPNNSESFRTVIDPDIYQESHPEWFEKTKIQLCLTAAGIVEETAKRGIEMLTQNPSATYFNMSQGDGNGYCTCDVCKAEIAKYKTSGYIIRFMNKVIDIMEKWHEENCPDRLIRYSTFAYQAGLHPPVALNDQGKYVPVDDSVVPHPKLYIRLTTMYACRSHRVDDPNCSHNSEYYQIYEGWNEICNNFTIYDYCANYDYFLSFYNNTGTLQSNLQYYKSIGLVQAGYQNTTGGKIKSMGVLENYLLGKLMWNVDENVNDLIKNFMTNYYKDAAPYMIEYFNFMKGYFAIADANRKGGVHQMIYNGSCPYLGTAEVWTRPVLEKAMLYIDQAMDVADSIEDFSIRNKVKNRVLEESVCVRYMIARNYSSYYIIDGATYLNFIDSFENDAKKIGANAVGEKESLSDFMTKLRAKLN